MERTLIGDLATHKGEVVLIQGWVSVRRDQGKMVFFDFRDRSGSVQGVVLPKSEAIEAAKEVRNEYVVSVTGMVNARPEKNVNAGVQNGDIELEVQKMEILSVAEIPFELGSEVNLDIYLDHLPFTLRSEKSKQIFKVQEAIIQGFRDGMKAQDFTEFQAPALVGGDAEGGASAFEVNYYYDKKAYLATSPQLYKQIAMSAFERVFSVNKVFRAEPSVTTRHITEIVSLDAEMAFIEDLSDIINLEDACVKFILSEVGDKCANELKIYQATLPAVIEKTPVISLKEAQEKIFARTGRDVRNEKDLNPEDEKDICQIIKEETGSDLVFVYGYPTRKKPFYVYPNPENPEVNEGVDLLCRGIEWSSGGRRINDYDQLLRHIKEWGMDPNKITLFLEAFKYGVPPEGGFALGLERLTMQILGLGNIREATMFPRDMERVDLKLEGRP